MKITINGHPEAGGPLIKDVLELESIPNIEYWLLVKTKDGPAMRVKIADLLRAIKALDWR